MADLIAVVFPSEEKAEEVRSKILGMQKDYLIDIGDAVIATKTDKGKVKLNQLMNTTAAGAAGGSFWGLLDRRPVPEPAARRRRRRRQRRARRRADRRRRQRQFMKGLAAEDLQPGEAVLFVLVKKVTGDKVLAQLKGVGGRVLQTSLDHTREDALRKALAGQVAASEARRACPAPGGRSLKAAITSTFLGWLRRRRTPRTGGGDRSASAGGQRLRQRRGEGVEVGGARRP